MALITCPECKKDLSDQAATCPNCGYPANAAEIHNDEADHEAPLSQNTKPNLGHSGMTRQRKTIVIASFAVLVVIAASLMISSAISRNKEEYLGRLNETRSLMLQGAAVAETFGNLTKSVWNDTIFGELNQETYKYTLKESVYDESKDYSYYVGYHISNDDIFNEDFNTSLTRLFADADAVTLVNSIKRSQDGIGLAMQELKNPPSNLDDCFKTIIELYDAYMGLTNTVVSPSGSLKTYSERFSEYDAVFMESYRKLELSLPTE